MNIDLQKKRKTFLSLPTSVIENLYEYLTEFPKDTPFSLRTAWINFFTEVPCCEKCESFNVKVFDHDDVGKTQYIKGKKVFPVDGWAICLSCGHEYAHDSDFPF